MSIENIFSFKGLRSKPVVLALLVGQLLFLIDLGWVVFYYLMGQKVGFWCPLGVENYEILSGYVPAISAMRVGISASFMEEALYRVVGMSLMMRISGNFWVANLFQAAAWGFMHSTYPQQPFYARGVELTLGGLLDGWILRRYGVIACVSSHYLFDTFLGVKPLFHSADLSLKTTAVLSCLPFVALLAYGASQASKSKDEDAKLLNRSINETIQVKELDEVEPDEKPISYQPIAPQRRLFYFVITVVTRLIMLRHAPAAFECGCQSKYRKSASGSARCTKVFLATASKRLDTVLFPGSPTRLPANQSNTFTSKLALLKPTLSSKILTQAAIAGTCASSSQKRLKSMKYGLMETGRKSVWMFVCLKRLKVRCCRKAKH